MYGNWLRRKLKTILIVSTFVLLVAVPELATTVLGNVMIIVTEFGQVNDVLAHSAVEIVKLVLLAILLYELTADSIWKRRR